VAPATQWIYGPPRGCQQLSGGLRFGAAARRRREADMHRDTVNREPDFDVRDYKNKAWHLLTRRASGDRSLTILVQRFEPGGSFADHVHDLVQLFYITRGAMEMTIGGETAIYREGDLVMVDRNVPHSGRNAQDSTSEILGIDYFPPDSTSDIGLR
jgi:quercetin dioxygenase-like cupin family protein